MIDREKVLNALRCHANCDRGFDCGDCAYIGNGDCLDLLAMDAYALLKEQERQLNEYHKADTFLAVHGFWSDNPPYGVKTSVELERP